MPAPESDAAAAVERDDRMLARVAAGERPPLGDPLADSLARWRAEVAAAVVASLARPHSRLGASMPEFVTVDAFAALERRVAALEGVEPEPEPEPMTYVVQAGDTLSRIADELAVTVEDLAAWNGITDPNLIRVGQVLAVTAPAAEPTPLPEPTPDPEPQPEPEPGPAVLSNLAASTDGAFVVLSWGGPDTIHLTAEDFDADGELIGETDQGLVTGSPQRRGPMGRRDGAGYRFAARPVYDDGTEGEVQVFPLATFPVESAPEPAPGPSPRPEPAPGGSDPGSLVAAVPFDGTTDDPFQGLERGDSGIRQWSQNGPNTFKLVEHQGQMWGRAQITGGPHDRDIRAEGIVVRLGTDDTVKMRPGDELWFGDTIIIGDGFPAQHFNNVLQWKNDGTGSAPMYLGAWDGALQLRSSFGNRAVGDIDFERPHRYVLGVRFDSDRRGWVEVWRDGVQTLARTPASTLHSGKQSYPKIGYYRGDELRGTGAVYHRDYRIGRTKASVE